MRIATWNMGYWGHSAKCEESWRWLLNDLRPDVALLQECVVPAWVHDSHNVLFAPALKKWGTAVVTRRLTANKERLPAVEAWFDCLGPDAHRKCAAARLSKWCVPAALTLPDGSSILVISLHNPAYSIDPTLYAHLDVSAIKLKHQRRRVWVQDVLFHFLKQSHVGRPLIVGGDFNTSRRFDIPKPRGNAEFFERVEEQFASLHRRFHNDDERTFFGNGEHQLDYLYADRGLASRATGCWVVPRAQVERFSDHSPLVAELDIDAA